MKSSKKVVLLGTASSGKSTLFKIICKEDEILSRIQLISQCIEAAVRLAKLAEEKQIHLQDKNYFLEVNPTLFMVDCTENMKQFPLVPTQMNKFLSDPNFDLVWSLRHETQVDDATLYLMQHFDLVWSRSSFANSHLHSHVRTVGFVDKKISSTTTLVDCGGAKSEIPKWKYIVPTSNRIVYCVSLVDPFTQCYEDSTLNRFEHAKSCFAQFVNTYIVPHGIRTQLVFTHVDALRNVPPPKKSALFPGKTDAQIVESIVFCFVQILECKYSVLDLLSGGGGGGSVNLEL